MNPDWRKLGRGRGRRRGPRETFGIRIAGSGPRPGSRDPTFSRDPRPRPRPRPNSEKETPESSPAFPLLIIGYYQLFDPNSLPIHDQLLVVDTRRHLETISVGTVPECFLQARRIIHEILDQYLAEWVIQCLRRCHELLEHVDDPK